MGLLLSGVLRMETEPHGFVDVARVEGFGRVDLVDDIDFVVVTWLEFIGDSFGGEECLVDEELSFWYEGAYGDKVIKYLHLRFISGLGQCVACREVFGRCPRLSEMGGDVDG